MRLALALLLAGLLVPVAGCLTCKPQLDVHHCRDTTGRCVLEGQVVMDWPEESGVFPDVDHYLRTLKPGEHGHATWTPEQEEAFWAFVHMPEDQTPRHVMLRQGGEVFQVRVLEC